MVANEMIAMNGTDIKSNNTERLREYVLCLRFCVLSKCARILTGADDSFGPTLPISLSLFFVHCNSLYVSCPFYPTFEVSPVTYPLFFLRKKTTRISNTLRNLLRWISVNSFVWCFARRFPHLLPHITHFLVDFVLQFSFLIRNSSSFF